MAGSSPRVPHGPLPEWSVREQLILASAVQRSGDQNWVSVSRAVRPLVEDAHPTDYFSQKNCALQYSAMLDKAATPKRRRSSEGVPEPVETVEKQIVRALVDRRVGELDVSLASIKAEYLTLKSEIDQLEKGELDEKVPQFWQEIQNELAAKEEAERRNKGSSHKLKSPPPSPNLAKLQEQLKLRQQKSSTSSMEQSSAPKPAKPDSQNQTKSPEKRRQSVETEGPPAPVISTSNRDHGSTPSSSRREGSVAMERQRSISTDSIYSITDDSPIPKLTVPKEEPLQPIRAGQPSPADAMKQLSSEALIIVQQPNTALVGLALPSPTKPPPMPSPTQQSPAPLHISSSTASERVRENNAQQLPHRLVAPPTSSSKTDTTSLPSGEKTGTAGVPYKERPPLPVHVKESAPRGLAVTICPPPTPPPPTPPPSTPPPSIPPLPTAMSANKPLPITATILPSPSLSPPHPHPSLTHHTIPTQTLGPQSSLPIDAHQLSVSATPEPVPVAITEPVPKPEEKEEEEEEKKKKEEKEEEKEEEEEEEEKEMEDTTEVGIGGEDSFAELEAQKEEEEEEKECAEGREEAHLTEEEAGKTGEMVSQDSEQMETSQLSPSHLPSHPHSTDKNPTSPSTPHLPPITAEPIPPIVVTSQASPRDDVPSGHSGAVDMAARKTEEEEKKEEEKKEEEEEEKKEEEDEGGKKTREQMREVEGRLQQLQQEQSFLSLALPPTLSITPASTPTHSSPPSSSERGRGEGGRGEGEDYDEEETPIRVRRSTRSFLKKHWVTRSRKRKFDVLDEGHSVDSTDLDSEDDGTSSQLSAVPSPAPSQSDMDPDTFQAHRQWRKAIMLVWQSAAQHKYANLFLHPVRQEDAPGYKDVILRPIDLYTIKKKIETGVIRTDIEFQRDMLLMFQNAFMYNSSDHAVYRMADAMRADAMESIQDYLATQLMVETSTPKVLRSRETRRGDLQEEPVPSPAKKRRTRADD